MYSTPRTPEATANLTAMIARAERRRAMLEELADVSMALSKEIAVRMIDGPYYPEPRHEPGRAFAVVSRAVRLTVALEAKVDRQIFAMCNGEVPAEPETARARSPADRSSPDDRSTDFGRRGSESESLVESEHEVLPSPEARREDSRRPAASPVGDVGEAEISGEICEDDNPDHFAVPPPRSRPDGGSRPPHFGGGRDLEQSVASGCADPPRRE